MIYKLYKYRYSFACVTTCLFLSMLIGIITKKTMFPWYATLTKPSFNPPNWIFGPVWTVLYTFIGIVFGILLENVTKYKYEIALFTTQYLLNLLWSPIFFYFHNIRLSLYTLILMVILTSLFTVRIRNEKNLLYLSFPYLLWISFAMVLNYKIYLLN